MIVKLHIGKNERFSDMPENPNSNQQLFEKLRDSLRQSILICSENGSKKQSSNEVSSEIELNDFIEKNGKVKEWLRARCLESASASIGLDAYLQTLLSFRGSSPSTTSPVNLLFASNQIVRALDPIAVKLIGEHLQRSSRVPKEKLRALLDVLKPKSDFTICEKDVYFDVDEVGYLRSLLLSDALERLHIPNFDKGETIERRVNLEFLGQIPEISLERLREASKKNPSLRIVFTGGILQWKYGAEPTIYVHENRVFFDLSEIEKMNASYDSVRRQFYLLKRALFSKTHRQQRLENNKTEVESESANKKEN